MHLGGNAIPKVFASLLVFIFVTFAIASGPASGKLRTVVVSVTGDWIYYNGANLSDQGEAVYFGETFPGLQSHATGAVCLFGSEGSIVLKKSEPGQEDKDSRLFAFTCEDASRNPRDPSCPGHTGSRCAIDASPNKDWQEGIFTVVRNWLASVVVPALAGNPKKYMVAGSRGAEDELVDAIVLLGDGQLDLSAVFGDMSAGRYWVKFSAIEGGPDPGSTTAHELEFRPKSPALVEAATMRPGLYRVSLVDHGTGELMGSDAWIFASGPNDYSANVAAFQQASDQASKLPREMDPTAARGLLRAYLESLAKGKREGRA